MLHLGKGMLFVMLILCVLALCYMGWRRKNGANALKWNPLKWRRRWTPRSHGVLSAPEEDSLIAPEEDSHTTLQETSEGTTLQVTVAMSGLFVEQINWLLENAKNEHYVVCVVESQHNLEKIEHENTYAQHLVVGWATETCINPGAEHACTPRFFLAFHDAQPKLSNTMWNGVFDMHLHPKSGLQIVVQNELIQNGPMLGRPSNLDWGMLCHRWNGEMWLHIVAHSWHWYFIFGIGARQGPVHWTTQEMEFLKWNGSWMGENSNLDEFRDKVHEAFPHLRMFIEPCPRPGDVGEVMQMKFEITSAQLEAPRLAAAEAARQAAEEAARQATEEAARHSAGEAARQAAEEAARHAAGEAAPVVAEEAVTHAEDEADDDTFKKPPDDDVEVADGYLFHNARSQVD